MALRAKEPPALKVHVTLSNPADLFFIICTAISAHANAISQGLTKVADKKEAIDGAWESSFYFLQFLWVATN